MNLCFYHINTYTPNWLNVVYYDWNYCDLLETVYFFFVCVSLIKVQCLWFALLFFFVMFFQYCCFSWLWSIRFVCSRFYLYRQNYKHTHTKKTHRMLMLLPSIATVCIRILQWKFDYQHSASLVNWSNTHWTNISSPLNCLFNAWALQINHKCVVYVRKYHCHYSKCTLIWFLLCRNMFYGSFFYFFFYCFYLFIQFLFLYFRWNTYICSLIYLVVVLNVSSLQFIWNIDVFKYISLLSYDKRLMYIHVYLIFQKSCK